MRKATLIIVSLILIGLHVVALGKVTEEAKRLPKGENYDYVIPGPLLKITALDFDSVASDFMFLKALVFLGSTQERTEEPKVKPAEWKWIYHVLNASTDLDPYFLDPYYFGNANLTWNAGLIKDANTLLDKGIHYRTWDSLLPFYAGFNYFYFLYDGAKASELLMEASRRQGGNAFYSDLAVKLAFNGKRTENAIAFQEYMLEHTQDPQLRKEYETRLIALRGIFFLEKAAGEYKRKFGRSPRHLQDMIARHIIARIPEEPYGGRYYIDTDGQIKTTSESKLMPYRRYNLFPTSPSSPSLFPSGEGQSLF